MGAIVVSLGGLSIVHIGLAPVRRLASQVKSLSANNLHQRLDGSGQPTELAPLVEQFNGLLGRLDQSYTQLEDSMLMWPMSFVRHWPHCSASNELALRRPASSICMKCCPPIWKNCTA